MARGGGAGDGSGDLGGGGGAAAAALALTKISIKWDRLQRDGYIVFMVGGSFGTVFAWDLRWQQQLILLSGVGLNGTDQRVSESEVWEVQYDSYTQSSGITSAPSTKILPIMVCLEDGILAVLEQGEDPVELLAEPCAINAFDIDPQNPSDVVCALEWKNMAILLRGRDAMAI
ncbi:Nuclear pore complex protein NUP43 [Ananas comosus]|uniref:Nuclear pore complex protein NUP43 n=1 Tax=Ananas comosus TaxID=4615 RepID=A0A199UIW8_ANACO|nr:Nuclear pore complex protein NUP43 [Ananas comosus]